MIDLRTGSATFVSSLMRAENPTRVALAVRSDGGWQELTYADLDRHSAAIGTHLVSGGVRPGDRVGLVGEAGFDWVAALLGIWRAGAVAVPFDAGLTETERGNLADRAPLAAMLTTSKLGDLPAAQHPTDVVRDPAHPALLVWTSGTTGEPKGVGLSFANLDYMVTTSVAEQGVGAEDSWLSVLGLNHLLELCCGLLACLRTGATASFPRTTMPHELAAAMAERKGTRMMAVPQLLRLLQPSLARTPEATAHLRALYSGGAPLSAEVLDAYAAIGVPVYQGYGLTELSPAVAMNSPHRNRPGSVGPLLPGVEARIDEGEIVVRSPGLMLGYWDGKQFVRDATDNSDEFRTGDLGLLDADGFLWVTGRAKNLLVLESGKKVAPEEVEAALARSAMFAEVAVIGLPRRGADEVCAVVVPAGDADPEAIEAEVRRCTEALSGYKKPTTVEIRTDPLPKTVKLSVRRADLLAEVLQRRGLA